VNTINDANRVIRAVSAILCSSIDAMILKPSVRLVLAIRGRPPKAGAPDRALGVGALGVVGHSAKIGGPYLYCQVFAKINIVRHV
jgi:hypothetical protein